MAGSPPWKSWPRARAGRSRNRSESCRSCTTQPCRSLHHSVRVMQELHHSALQELHHSVRVMQELHHSVMQELHHSVMQELHHSDRVMQELHHSDRVMQELHHSVRVMQELHHSALHRLYHQRAMYVPYVRYSSSMISLLLLSTWGKIAARLSSSTASSNICRYRRRPVPRLLRRAESQTPRRRSDSTSVTRGASRVSWALSLPSPA